MTYWQRKLQENDELLTRLAKRIRQNTDGKNFNDRVRGICLSVADRDIWAGTRYHGKKPWCGDVSEKHSMKKDYPHILEMIVKAVKLHFEERNVTHGRDEIETGVECVSRNAPDSASSACLFKRWRKHQPRPASPPEIVVDQISMNENDP